MQFIGGAGIDQLQVIVQNTRLNFQHILTHLIIAQKCLQLLAEILCHLLEIAIIRSFPLKADFRRDQVLPQQTLNVIICSANDDRTFLLLQ
jgi:hypothetical protein